MKVDIKKNLINTLMWLKDLIPMLLGILLLISMLRELWFFTMISPYLEENFLWILFSDLFWSISLWSAINSYVIADSIWNLEQNMLIITAFLISWVTVWIIQLPAEMYFLGKRFALIRNILSFMFAIVWSYIVYFFYFI